MATYPRAHANVAVRLPEDLLNRLEQMRADDGARSLAQVVDQLLSERLDDTEDFRVRRQPLTAERRHMFLRIATVERLRELALDHATQVGSVVYTLLITEASTLPSRPVRLHADKVQAQAA